MFDYDLFLIGGGSGGVRAARLASETGARVGLAEESRMGGTCVIRGCVPKKLMVNAADFSHAFKDARGFGWTTGPVSFDWPSFRAAKDREIDRLEQMYRNNLANAGVEVFDMRAIVENSHCVRLADGRKKTAKHILIAVGGKPFLPSIPGIEHVKCSNDMFLLDELPNRILVVGGGYIACEFACIFEGMGCKVTQYYRGEQVLRGFDNELREHVANAMAERGVTICLETDVVNVEKKERGISVTSARGGTDDFDMVLYATGRRPNTSGLGLENVGVKFGKAGEVMVNAHSQSSVPSIFAVGDATDRVNLTPVAIREAAAFVETVFKGNPTSADHDDVPTAVFTRPEVGSVGLTEESACRKGPVEIYSTRFRPLSGVIAGREERIFMKLVVCRRTRRVLGVHMAGPNSAELIQLAGLAVKMNATKEDFDRTVAVHPTAAEELVTLKEPTRVT